MEKFAWKSSDNMLISILNKDMGEYGFDLYYYGYFCFCTVFPV